MGRFAWVLLAGVALGIARGMTTAHAGIQVEPAQPTELDSIRVIVSGGDPVSGCRQIVAQSCARPSPDSLVVSLDIQYCNGVGHCPCLMFPWSFQRTCVFGPLPAGDYVVRFSQRRLNPVDPRPDTTETARVTVDAATPGLRRTWGAVKSKRH